MAKCASHMTTKGGTTTKATEPKFNATINVGKGGKKK